MLPVAPSIPSRVPGAPGSMPTRRAHAITRRTPTATVSALPVDSRMPGGGMSAMPFLVMMLVWAPRPATVHPSRCARSSPSWMRRTTKSRRPLLCSSSSVAASTGRDDEGEPDASVEQVARHRDRRLDLRQIGQPLEQRAASRAGQTAQARLDERQLALGEDEVAEKRDAQRRRCRAARCAQKTRASAARAMTGSTERDVIGDEDFQDLREIAVGHSPTEGAQSPLQRLDREVVHVGAGLHTQGVRRRERGQHPHVPPVQQVGRGEQAQLLAFVRDADEEAVGDDLGGELHARA